MLLDKWASPETLKSWNSDFPLLSVILNLIAAITTLVFLAVLASTTEIAVDYGQG